MPYHCPEIAERAVANAKTAPARSVAVAHLEMARHYDNLATHELLHTARENINDIRRAALRNGKANPEGRLP